MQAVQPETEAEPTARPGALAGSRLGPARRLRVGSRAEAANELQGAVLGEEHRTLADAQVVDGLDLAAVANERAVVVGERDRLLVGPDDRQLPVADRGDAAAVVLEGLRRAVDVERVDRTRDGLRGRAFDHRLVGAGRRAVTADVPDDDRVAVLRDDRGDEA